MDSAKKYIFVTGGNFQNMGAMAMTLVSVSRLKTQYPEYEIVLISEVDSQIAQNENIYSFPIWEDFTFRGFVMGTIKRVRNLLRHRSTARPSSRVGSREWKDRLRHTRYLFDISGYALSSQWRATNSVRFLARLAVAQHMGITCILMPQSFGPFEYSPKLVKRIMILLIRFVLGRCLTVYAREVGGTNLLHSIGLVNVKQADDIVLLNKDPIDRSLVYRDDTNHHFLGIDEIPAHAIAIVPNMRTIEHGSKNQILESYFETIKWLRIKGHSVYLLTHSSEDHALCEWIGARWAADSSVHVLSEDFPPDEFENVIQRFDFAVVSRFHAIVHSYRRGVPCVIAGWADKYTNLAHLLNQDSYVMDFRQDTPQASLLELVGRMDTNYRNESRVVRQAMEELQSNDPFDQVFELIKGSRQ